MRVIDAARLDRYGPYAVAVSENAHTRRLAEDVAAAREYLRFAREGTAVIGIMTADEIEDTLRRHRIGRIGCSVGDRPYVVPINYAYDGALVYAFSASGR